MAKRYIWSQVLEDDDLQSSARSSAPKYIVYYPNSPDGAAQLLQMTGFAASNRAAALPRIHPMTMRSSWTAMLANTTFTVNPCPFLCGYLASASSSSVLIAVRKVEAQRTNQ